MRLFPAFEHVHTLYVYFQAETHTHTRTHTRTRARERASAQMIALRTNLSFRGLLAMSICFKGRRIGFASKQVPDGSRLKSPKAMSCGSSWRPQALLHTVVGSRIQSTNSAVLELLGHCGTGAQKALVKLQACRHGQRKPQLEFSSHLMKAPSR